MRSTSFLLSVRDLQKKECTLLISESKESCWCLDTMTSASEANDEFHGHLTLDKSL